MEAEVAKQLIKLNHRFYQEFASSFSETRQRLQPGVLRVVEGIPPDASILDLGCGNGELGRELVSRGFVGRYVGVDFSEGLLEVAREKVQSPQPEVQFVQADLTGDEWDKGFEDVSFDFVLCFATLHHIPSRALRIAFLDKVKGLLAEDGRFVFSSWQFLNSERLKVRIQPWEAVGLNDENVDEGDYLLDWRRDGVGLRYVHQYSEAELEELARETGLVLEESFVSDGEGGDLGLYQVWRVGK
ncbi:MAG: class I SAM-dependent methyltransferase [Chloroflexi bacterium]|nr:MAG: class I SAM-dependent methyltransferase [Chloroflexota bacterium]MBL1194385.1 class I SAM-dependent methyltransferase [Chloroflexota bacterium]NOH11673.1 class I SAM-dependent methyltransferase [Chloroflexota bacterium]